MSKRGKRLGLDLQRMSHLSLSVLRIKQTRQPRSNRESILLPSLFQKGELKHSGRPKVILDVCGGFENCFKSP